MDDELNATEVSVVDAHVHVWDLARRPQPWIDPTTMAVLNRDHLLTDLEAELAVAGVHAAVLVQVLNDPGETEDYLWTAARSPFQGVVPWLDLLASDVEERLDAVLAHPTGAHVAGIRHQALAEADPAGWLTRAGDAPGLGLLGERGLAFDLMLRPEHLDTAYGVVRAHPDTVFVLDHGGKPPVRSGWGSDQSRRWAGLTARLGALQNLTCKLSGLTTMADPVAWTVDDLAPYVDHLLACFGPERLLFGSDWPVSLRAGDYARTVETARALVAPLSSAEQAAVLSGTAARVYRLCDSRLA